MFEAWNYENKLHESHTRLGGAGDDAASAAVAEQEIPYSSSGGGFSPRNILKGKITKKKAILGGGIAGIFITAIMGGSAMVALQPIHLLENLARTFDMGGSTINLRVARNLHKAFANNNGIIGGNRATDFFVGVNQRTLNRFASNGMTPLCGNGARLCTSADKNIFGRYRTDRLAFGDVRTSQTFSYNDLRYTTDPGVQRQLRRTMSRTYSWFDDVSARFFSKIRTGAIRAGLIRDNPNRPLTQTEVDSLLARMATGEDVRNLSTTQGNTINVDENGNRSVVGVDDIINDIDARSAIDQYRNAENRGGKANVTRTMNTASRQRIGRALRTGGLYLGAIQLATGISCMAYQVVNMVVALQRTVGLEQRRMGAVATLATIEQIKAGDAESDTIAGIMNKINARSSYDEQVFDPITGEVSSSTVSLTGSESDAYKYAVENRNITLPSPPIVENMNNSTIQGFVTAAAARNPSTLWLMHPGGGEGIQRVIDTCNVITHPAVQIGTTVLVFAAVAVGTYLTGGAGPGAVAQAIWAGLSAVSLNTALGLASTFLLPHLLDMAAQNLVPVIVATLVGDVFGIDAYGQDFMAKLISGASAVYGQNNRAQGVLAATPESARVAWHDHQVFLAEQSREERENRSPFDMTTTHTFMGSFLSSIMPQMSGLQSPSGFLGAIGNLFNKGFGALIPSVSAANDLVWLGDAFTNYWCDYEENISVDIFCNPYYVTANAAAEPEDVLQRLIDEREVEIIITGDEEDEFGGAEARIHSVNFGIYTSITTTEYDEEGNLVRVTTNQCIDAYSSPNSHPSSQATRVYGGFYDSSNNESGVDSLETYPYTSWSEGDTDYVELGASPSRNNCAAMTGLYEFQKDFVERTVNMGEEILPTVTNYALEWIDGPNFLQSIIGRETHFRFKDSFDNAPSSGWNFRTISRRWHGSGERMRGWIGLDNGGINTLYSLFFIDRNIQNAMNGTSLVKE